MRIGDVEYTRTWSRTLVTDLVSEAEVINFAVGTKVRALLVGAQASMEIASVVNHQAGIFFENGNSVAVGQNFNGLFNDTRLVTFAVMSQRLATNGVFQQQYPVSTLWWRILQPTVQCHFVGPLTADDFRATLRYRWVELTDDEIVEIAAQRAQD